MAQAPPGPFSATGRQRRKHHQVTALALPLSFSQRNTTNDLDKQASQQAKLEIPYLAAENTSASTNMSAAQARITKPGTNFLNLPAELKNTIYKLTLRHHQSIHIGKRGQTTHLKKRWDRSRSQQTCGWDSDSLRKTQIHMYITVPLLLANKQIHDEATSILYGGNSFFFSNHPLVHTWAQQIGSSFAQLRSIEIPVDVWMQLPASREYPVRASRLQSLTLSVSALRLVGAKNVAKHISSFLADVTDGRDAHFEFEIVEEPSSTYMRDRAWYYGIFDLHAEDEQIVVYGDEVKRCLRRIMKKRAEEAGQA